MAVGDTEQTIFTQLWVASGKPATEDEAGYEALSWTRVAKPITLPERGDTQEDVNESSLDDGRTEHFNGVVDGGVLTFPFIWVEGDAGQAILLAHDGGNDTFSFKEIEPDAATVHAYYGRCSTTRWREASANGLKGFMIDCRVNSARTTYDVSD